MKKPTKSSRLDFHEVLAEAEWVSSDPEHEEPKVHRCSALPCLFCGGDRTDIELEAEHLGPLCAPCFRRWRAH